MQPQTALSSSDLPGASSLSPGPAVPPAPPPALPVEKSANFRTRMKLSYQQDNNVDLQLICRQLDEEDTDLASSKRYHVSYRTNTYYRELQNTVLHCMSKKLKNATIDGDFNTVEALQSPEELPEQLRPLTLGPNTSAKLNDDQKGYERPVIYTHFHVDSFGRPPSPNEYKNIMALMIRYIAIARDVLASNNISPIDQAFADSMDNAMPSLDPQKDRWGVSEGHLRQIHNSKAADEAESWMTTTNKIIATIPSTDHDNPMPHAITETGWTIKPYDRRHAHWFWTGGNKLLGLIDAATRKLERDSVLPREYRMKFVVSAHDFTREGLMLEVQLILPANRS